MKNLYPYINSRYFSTLNSLRVAAELLDYDVKAWVGNSIASISVISNRERIFVMWIGIENEEINEIRVTNSVGEEIYFGDDLQKATRKIMRKF